MSLSIYDEWVSLDQQRLKVSSAKTLPERMKALMTFSGECAGFVQRNWGWLERMAMEERKQYRSLFSSND